MLYLVTGPPAAGKTTWVRERAGEADIVIDYDLIANALRGKRTGPTNHVHPEELARVTKAARQAAIDAALAYADEDDLDVYVIHGTPSARTVARYREIGAQVVTIDPGQPEVVARARRERPAHMLKVIDEFYAEKPRRPAVARKRTTAERGYGPDHKAERKRWEPVVRSGRAICWRCNRPIPPSGPWDLGHDDVDRSKYMGPEHVGCNRGAPSRNRAANCDTSREW